MYLLCIYGMPFYFLYCMLDKISHVGWNNIEILYSFSLVLNVLIVTFSQRPSAKELLKHRFIKNARKTPKLLERIRLMATQFQPTVELYQCSSHSCCVLLLLVWAESGQNLQPNTWMPPKMAKHMLKKMMLVQVLSRLIGQKMQLHL